MKHFLNYLPLAGFVFLFSCSPENDIAIINSQLKDKQVAMQLSYEIESLTQVEVLAPGENANLAFLD